MTIASVFLRLCVAISTNVLPPNTPSETPLSPCDRTPVARNATHLEFPPASTADGEVVIM